MRVQNLKIQREEKRQELQTKISEIDSSIEKRDLENAKAVKELVEALKTDIKELDDLISDEEGEEEEEKPNDDEEENDNMNKRGEKRSMSARNYVPEGTAVVPNTEQRDAFANYLETRDIAGGSLKTDSGFVVVPEEVVTEIMTLKEAEYNLDQYVTVKTVSHGTGKYPVVRQSEVAALTEVEELAENPELAVKPFYNLAYDIKTYRGYFLISREAIEDSAVNVLQELMTWMARTIAATRNAAIVKAIKEGTVGKDNAGTLKFETAVAEGIDGIKDEINLNLKPNYEHNVAVVSQSAFAALDKMKDEGGNYLLQPDIKEESSKRLLGAKVEVLPDEMLGEDAASTIIIGNLKDGIVLFDRSQYQAGWTDYMHFGEALMVAVRQDVRILDEKAAIVIDFTDSPELP